jgi:hypothetical protein
MYEEMYSLASYGIDEGAFQLSSNEFIQYPEHEYAIERALISLKISDVLIDLIATGELPRQVRQSRVEGAIASLSLIEAEHFGVGRQQTDFDPVADYRRNL